jgi:hypothetical protein
MADDLCGHPAKACRQPTERRLRVEFTTPAHTLLRTRGSPRPVEPSARLEFTRKIKVWPNDAECEHRHHRGRRRAADASGG